MNMQIHEQFFLDSLVRFVENPCMATRLGLSRNQMSLNFLARQEEEAREKRIVEKVLEQLSVRLDNDGMLKEIESLRDELQKLYKMFD